MGSEGNDLFRRIVKSVKSKFKKVLRLVSQRGLKRGVREALDAWARNRINITRNVLETYDYILLPERREELQAPINGPLRINWLIPPVVKGGGGLFNIFRAIYYLEQWGHTNRIYMITDSPSNAVAATLLVRSSYFPIKANIEIFNGNISDSDALVCTSWITAYRARAIGNTAKKFYFVQDLEHMFYAEGSHHEFAKNTYRWGFYGLTAGKWISDVLSQEYGMDCSSFGFSYDRDTYSSQGHQSLPKGKRRVLAYVRPSTERRGYELAILALSLVARKLTDVEFVLVGYSSLPAHLPFNAVAPGILSAGELGPLYRSCDVALVLSHTNVSLLPLELMACGCPVISNRGPNVEWLLSDDIAQLTDATPEAISKAIIQLLEDDFLRKRKRADGLRFAEQTDWACEIKAMETALYKGLGMKKRVYV